MLATSSSNNGADTKVGTHSKLSMNRLRPTDRRVLGFRTTLMALGSATALPTSNASRPSKRLVGQACDNRDATGRSRR